LTTAGCSVSMHYLIARREATGFELPHTFFYSGEGALPVFSSVEAARGFLASRNLGQGWRVRECSAGELVSLLFVLHEKWRGSCLTLCRSHYRTKTRYRPR